MKLMTCLFWLESKRLRLHIIATFLIVAMLVLLLGVGFGDVSALQYQIQLDADDAYRDVIEGLSSQAIYVILSTLIPGLMAASLVLLVSMLAPFRGSNEWQNGQFQMFKMSSWSLYHIQLGRFLTLCLFGLISLSAIAMIMVIALGSHPNTKIPGLGRDILWISFFLALSLYPLFTAIGMLIDSIRTAYYLKGLHFIVSLIQFAGWASLILLSFKLRNALSFEIFPPIELTLSNLIPGNDEQMIQLKWEPMLISIVLAVVFVIVSSRVLEEAES